jgi:Ca2+:H+ antiporter
MGIVTSLIASLGAVWISEILVGAAEEAGQSLGMSQMGVIVLALVGGAAESGSAIAMGPARWVDLRIGIALGSCVQITLFVLRCWCWSRLPFRQYHVAALWDSWSISWVAK